MKKNAIHFCKMQGLGNDFIIINAMTQKFPVNKNLIKKLSHRHLGIGFDQLLILEKSASYDFYCRIFNADGSEAEQCGNGMRCLARFIQEKQLSSKTQLILETQSGPVTILPNTPDNDIKVIVGKPQIQPPQEITIDMTKKTIFPVIVGNPHAILTVPSVAEVPVNDWGKSIGNHKNFPQGVNVGFMQIINKNHIRLRTFERGVGETFACGSNSCAAVAAGREMGLLDNQVEVELALGKLQVEWDGTNAISLTGPAEKVFEGVFEINDKT